MTRIFVQVTINRADARRQVLNSKGASLELDIAVRISRPYGVRVDRRWLKQVVAETLKVEQVSRAEVSLVIVGDKKIRDLNRQYRNVDAPTDVIAFALAEPTKETFVAPPDDILHLGEVVVSFPRAAAQALERGRSTEEELVTLTVHGVLHLLGFDHEEAAEGRRMKTREKKIFARLKGKRLC